MVAVKREQEKLLPLAQIDQAGGFEGFSSEDFAVFDAAEFQDRMPLLKARLTPKLKQVAAALVERMGQTAEEKIYPHVALHLRRSVNPPVETWAAFARNARAYKPFVHYRVGIGAEKVRVVVFVEDYADEKLLFAQNLAKNAKAIAAWCAHHPTIHAYEILDNKGEAKAGSALNGATLRKFADRMKRVKGQHARFGIAFDKSHPVLAKGPECLEAVVEAARILRPFYDCGKPGFKFTYVPESIAGL